MNTLSADIGTVRWLPAWTRREIEEGVRALIAAFAARLPEDRGARVVIKPNLNNDLVALTGNCADLRVLDAILADLRDRGYHDLTIADGSNVGVERRSIDTFKRLRVDKLALRYGARCVDLNRDEGERVQLRAGANPIVGRTILENDVLISVPKVKTHAEAGFSCAMKNWVGIARGQDKRHMHYDLGRNIAAINEVVRPDIVIVDGLVGMEGNGPGDGEPFRLGLLVGSDDAVLNDLVVARLVDLPWEQVPYLRHAFESGRFEPRHVAQVRGDVPVLRAIRRAPPRSPLAVLSEDPRLMKVKLAVRPLVDQPAVAQGAYRLGIIQDVYSFEDDGVTAVRRNETDCGDCRLCEDFCPTGLLADEIGRTDDPARCIGCMYCWWVCPKGALELEGPVGHLQRQIDRYKADIERL